MKNIRLALLLSLMPLAAVHAENTEGKMLFKNRCASCHNLEQRLVGTALKDVAKRRDENWLVSFIHSSQSVIKSGDAAAVALFAEYNQTLMPDHPDLSAEQVKSILAYIAEAGAALDATPRQTIRRPAENRTWYQPLSWGDTHFWGLFFIGLVVGFWGLYTAVVGKEYARRFE